ncbi:MAG: NADH-quinone oxidoreductase subunit NuoF [Candidatus Omnitrophica bacterium]|nr:NADH-quinone oxidoreductase subunit NuoF [Candidatus Omnitrophota bacterium]
MPKRAVRICATGCRALGALDVYDAFKKELKRAKLQKKVALIKTGCQGFCSGAPLLSIDPDNILYVGVKVDDVKEIVDTTLIEGRPIERLCYQDNSRPAPDPSKIPFFSSQKRVILTRCGYIDPTNIDDALAQGAYEIFEKTLTSMAPEAVIDEVKRSGLRGRGGAGFSTGLKWGYARNAKGDAKYLICNGDEGDPGAFMDRALLEGDPHLVLEGMLIAAYAIGATKGYIYVRAEYPIAIEHLKVAIEQAKRYKLLGKNILGTDFNFEIKIKQGAGAFVCGEETALIASIEGKRGQPRPRPPFPAQSGLWGKPTNINNVETLANVPVILKIGAKEYAKLGTKKSKGTKIFALAGKVNNTGLIEVPMGITLRELVEDIGGGIPKSRCFKAALIGGPSGGCVPAQFLDKPIDYESVKEIGAIMGSGGLIILDETSCMVDIARYFMEFCAKESCGKCPPCRIGTTRMLDILQRICDGSGVIEDISKLEELALQVKKNSLCGLGQTAPNPVLSTLRYFKDEYIEHILLKKCRASACPKLVKAPCTHACPAGIDVPTYITLAAEERFKDSLKVIHARNPFISVCGRVCDHPCEFRCRRTDLDEPLAIRDIKRTVSESVTPPWNILEQWTGKNTKHKVAVVGAGPAGLSCAYFLRFFGHQVTVFESCSEPGGMLRVGIPRYRLPLKQLKADIDFIMSTGVELKLESSITSLNSLFDAGYEAVFLGVGAHESVSLENIDVSNKNILDGIEFLKDVSFRSVTGNLGKVIVIGGGNVAIDAARSARRFGSEVTVVYRRTKKEMPAYAREIEEAIEEGITFQFLTQPIEPVMKKDSKLAALQCARMKLDKADKSGRKRPVKIENSEFELPCDTVILAIGQKVSANSAWGLEIDDRGLYKIDISSLATSNENVFAGGDCARGPSSIVQAIGDGQRAACSIDKIFSGNGELPENMYISHGLYADEETKTAPRPKPECLTLKKRASSFEEVAATLDAGIIKEESRRCLRCDLEKD